MNGVELNKNRPMFDVQEQYLLAVGLKTEINSIRFIYFDNGSTLFEAVRCKNRMIKILFVSYMNVFKTFE